MMPKFTAMGKRLGRILKSPREKDLRIKNITKEIMIVAVVRL